jgi:hypothetical protein
MLHIPSPPSPEKRERTQALPFHAPANGPLPRPQHLQSFEWQRLAALYFFNYHNEL